MTDNHIPNERRLYEYKSVYTNTDNTIDDKIMENLHQPIIIDGVDVRECAWCICETDTDPYCKINDGEDLGCEDNPNCYYKQLKRKEQEYERLSSLIRETQTYSDVCCVCRDEILIYPSISGRRDYSQIEVEERSLKKIIQQFNQLKAENEKLEAQIEADTQYHVKEECNLRKIIRNKEKRNVELHKENNQLKALKEQAEQKLERIRQVCAETKSIENIKDMYTAKLSGLYLKSRQILQIIDKGENDENL